jgi:hypothetical protein
MLIVSLIFTVVENVICAGEWIEKYMQNNVSLLQFEWKVLGCCFAVLGCHATLACGVNGFVAID